MTAVASAQVPKPQPLPVAVERIPAAMRAERRWVVWNYVWRAANGKPGKWTKPPYVATAPMQPADSTDPSKWRSFEDALSAYEDGKCDGIGFVLGDGWVGFDVDHGEAPEHMQLLNTYTERSPSGEGLHAIMRGAKPGTRSRTGPYELYDHGRYFTVTGQHIEGFPATVEDRTAEIAALYARLFPNGNGAAAPAPPSPATDDDALIAKAVAANKGKAFTKLWSGDISRFNGDDSAANLALCNMLARMTNRDPARMDRLFRRSGLMRPKWDERRGDSTWGAQTIAKALAGGDDFRRAENGSIYANDQSNIKLALQKLVVVAEYDGFAERHQLVINGTPRDFSDETLDTLWLQVDTEFKFRPQRELFHTVVKVLAWSNRRHPVKEYLDALRWDGIPRIGEWLVVYGQAPNTPFVRAVGALVLTAAVRRVRQPGCKFDEMLLLESDQGTGKSTMLSTLCPDDEWFSDDLPLNVDTKQLIERTSGKWLIEAAELNGHGKAQTEHLKSMLSRKVDGPVRMAYARQPVSRRRQFIIVGTLNLTQGYLKDPTGNRRFWPVRVGAFRLDELRRDRDQLWAEAAYREAQGVSIRLDPTLYTAAAEQQEKREHVDPWYETLAEVTADMSQIESEQVWKELNKFDVDKRDNRDAVRVAEVMQKLGFSDKRKIRVVNDDGKKVQRVCWLRDSGDEQEIPDFMQEDGDCD